jgi:hypothetical protein
MIKHILLLIIMKVLKLLNMIDKSKSELTERNLTGKISICSQSKLGVGDDRPVRLYTSKVKGQKLC